MAGMIAPQTLHLNLGKLDAGSPIDEARAGLAKISAGYPAAGTVDQFSFYVEAAAGHVMPSNMC